MKNVAGTKNVSIKISTDDWKVLKKCSIDEDITLQEFILKVLENFIDKKMKKEMNKKMDEDIKDIEC